MIGEKYNMTWYSYSEHLVEMMKELMNDKGSQDVTLVCEDKTKIKAHKIVLKACSPVFANILEGDMNPNPIIYLRGIHQQELESVLQFMYLGQATFYESRMSELLRVARSLEVKELSQEEVAEDNYEENHDGNSQATFFEAKTNQEINTEEESSKAVETDVKDIVINYEEKFEDSIEHSNDNANERKKEIYDVLVGEVSEDKNSGAGFQHDRELGRDATIQANNEPQLPSHKFMLSTVMSKKHGTKSVKVQRQYTSEI